MTIVELYRKGETFNGDIFFLSAENPDEVSFAFCRAALSLDSCVLRLEILSSMSITAAVCMARFFQFFSVINGNCCIMSSKFGRCEMFAIWTDKLTFPNKIQKSAN